MDVRERQHLAKQIEALIQEVAAFPDAQARTKTEELLHTLLEIYGEGLKRVIELTAQAEDGQTLLAAFIKDETVESLLLLHGLHPVKLETRLQEALEGIHLKAQEGSVELLHVEDGIAEVRLVNSGHGCSASSGALRQRVEAAIYRAAPDLDELRIEEQTKTTPKFIPLARVNARKHQENAPVSEQAITQTSQEQNQASVSGTR